MKEGGPSRSFSGQLQAALLSSQSDHYLHQLGIGSSNGTETVRREQPVASSSTTRAESEDQCIKRTTQDLSIVQLLAPLEPAKLSKQQAKLHRQGAPRPCQNADLPAEENVLDSEAAKKAQSKAAKAERDARLRVGAAQYQEILRKGPPKPKPGLLERIANIKAEKAARDTQIGDDNDTTMDSVESVSDSRQRAQGKPPVWSTSLQDLRTADELCPDAEAKKGKLGVKLSRGGIARAVLFADSVSVQSQRLGSRGAVYFDVAVRMSKKRAPAEGHQHNGEAGNANLSASSQSGKKIGTSSRKPPSSETPEAAAVPAPPPRRSFMERRMARGWAYQQMPQDVMMSQPTHQPVPNITPPPETVRRILTADTFATSPSKSASKQEACTDATEAREVPISNVNALDQFASSSQAASVMEPQKEARDASTEGLVEAYRLETPVYLYVAGRCKCIHAVEQAASCVGESCGALRLLPCKLPDRVEAVGVGWTTIVDVEMLVRPQPTIRFYLRIDPSLEKDSWWWLPVAPNSRGWKLPRKPPPISHQPESHRPSGLLSALVCSSCHATALRQHWQGWTCSHCSLSVPATALSSDYDVDWGKMPILTEGPRMDNGRVLCIPPIARTDIKIWGDGIKVVDYTLPAARSLSAGMTLRDATTGDVVEQPAVKGVTSDVRLHHFLSCGDWRRTCDKLLQDLLAPGMPYERTLGSNGRLQHFFSTAFFLTAQATSHLVPFLPSPVLDVEHQSAAANTLLDAVDAVESIVSRMNIATHNDANGERMVAGLEEAAPLMPFSTLTATVADVKDKLELLSIAPAPPPPSDISSQVDVEPPPGRRQIAYLHLGSPAAMLISTTRRDPLAGAGAGARGGAGAGAASGVKNRRPFQLLFSCMMAHGDVVLIRCGKGSEYKIIVETQKLHVGLVFT